MNGPGFWKVAGALAGGVALVWLVFGYSASNRAGEELLAARKLADAGGELTRHGLPAGEVEASLAEAGERLDALEKELTALTLEVPAELEPAPDRDMLYVQRRVSVMRDVAASRGLQIPAASALGFRDDVSSSAMPRTLLRLAVIERLARAAADAGVQAITRGEAVELASPDGLDLIGCRVTLSADEKTLLHLIRNLTVPGGALALRSVDIRVRDRSSGAFQAVLDVAGVTVKDAPEAPPAARPSGPEKLPEGVLVPTMPPGVF